MRRLFRRRFREVDGVGERLHLMDAAAAARRQTEGDQCGSTPPTSPRIRASGPSRTQCRRRPADRLCRPSPPTVQRRAIRGQRLPGTAGGCMGRGATHSYVPWCESQCTCPSCRRSQSSLPRLHRGCASLAQAQQRAASHGSWAPPTPYRQEIPAAPTTMSTNDGVLAGIEERREEYRSKCVVGGLMWLKSARHLGNNVHNVRISVKELQQQQQQQ